MCSNPVKVLNRRGEIIAPTTRKKAKDLLKQSKAYIVSQDPFTIQLKISTGESKC